MRGSRLSALLLLMTLLAPRAGSGAPPDPAAIYGRETGWPRAARLAALERQYPRREVHYWVGMALLQVGLRSCALRRFEQVLDLGPGPFYEEAAARLVEDLAFPLERKWETLERPDISGLPPALSGRLAHKLGLHHLRRGELATARGWLKRHPDRAPARYLLATVALAEGRRAQAREHLRSCLRLTAGTDRASGEQEHELKELGELAQLGLARLHQAEGRLTDALARYQAIPLESPHFFRARQELAWVHLQRDEPERALAQRVILQAPRFARYFYPDGAMVEAVALHGRCHLRRARETARALKGSMVRNLETLTLFLRGRPEERYIYLEAMAAAAGEGEALSKEHIKALLADTRFRRVVLVVRQLQRERGLLASRGTGALQRQLGAELDGRLVAAQAAAGSVTRRVLTVLAAELRALRQQSEALLFEVEQRGAAAAIRRRTGLPGASPRTSPRSPAVQTAVRWPYDGALWPDEVNHLVVRLPSRCAAAQEGGSGKAPR